MKKVLVMLSLLVVAMFLVGCAPAEEGDEDAALAGEAFKSRECSKVSNCGFVTAEELPAFTCEVFEIDPVVEGIVATDSYNGFDFCTEQGYGSCVQLSRNGKAKYYASTDGSCKGVQYMSSRYTLLQCTDLITDHGLINLGYTNGDTPGASGFDDFPCQTKSDPLDLFEEPIEGDQRAWEELEYQVTCCKFL